MFDVADLALASVTSYVSLRYQVRCPMIPSRGQQLFRALRTTRGICSVLGVPGTKAKLGDRNKVRENKPNIYFLTHSFPSQAFTGAHLV